MIKKRKKSEATLSCAFKDLRPAQSEKAEAIIGGHYAFASGTHHTGPYLPFGFENASPAWQKDLHSFAWLRHFSAGDDDMADLARYYVKAWLAEKDWHHQAWTLPTTAQRVISWLINGHLLSQSNHHKNWQLEFRKALIYQGKFLLRRLRTASTPSIYTRIYTGTYSEGRISASVALILLGLSLPGYDHWLERGLTSLNQEITTQILPDGGHISRNPSEHLLILFDLLTLKINLLGQGRPGPEKLLGAVDRMLPMLRFFRHGDGHLALFNGAMEEDPINLQAALAQDDIRGGPFGFAPHSGYQRMASGRTLLLMDTGQPPPKRYARNAHAGCLSLEMSSGKQRFIVNCGGARSYDPVWQGTGRATNAHSTLTLNNTSSAKFSGWRKILFNQKLNGLSQVDSHRKENQDGVWLEAGHNGYARNFLLTHRRQLFLASDGKTLHGEDRLQSVNPQKNKSEKKKQIKNFIIRFHFHPHVRCGLTHHGQHLIARLPNGEGWQFKAQIQQHQASQPQPCRLSKQESIYLGGNKPRRAEQLVIEGKIATHTAPENRVKVNWLWQRIDKIA